MDDLKQYFLDNENDCRTCHYRKGNVCTEYRRGLEIVNGEYAQLDECMNDDETAIEGGDTHANT